MKRGKGQQGKVVSPSFKKASLPATLRGRLEVWGKGKERQATLPVSHALSMRVGREERSQRCLPFALGSLTH